MNKMHRGPQGGTRIAPRQATGKLVRAIVGLIGLLTIGIGVWSFADPASFAAFVQFPMHTHFLHDIGAFQIGIGVTLLLALLWEDGVAVALGGFLTGNTLHIVSHVMDGQLGGRPTDWLWLSLLSVISLVTLLARLRQIAATRPR